MNEDCAGAPMKQMKHIYNHKVTMSVDMKSRINEQFHVVAQVGLIWRNSQKLNFNWKLWAIIYQQEC
jgi:hypothetical protein